MNINESLIKISDIEKQSILDLLSLGDIKSAKDISLELDIEESKIISLLNDDDFYNEICARSISDLRISYHSTAIPKLISNLENDKDFYNSFDRISKVIGAVKERDNVIINLSLEELLKSNSPPLKKEKVIEVKKQEKDITNGNNPNVERSVTNGNIFEIEDNSNSDDNNYLDSLFWEDEE